MNTVLSNTMGLKHNRIFFKLKTLQPEDEQVKVEIETRRETAKTT